ncbi:MAG: hypothetical protein MRZ66_07970 [Clostridiales bacterium]|nr:hypothetical protein [Clostridiales bacterium]
MKKIAIGLILATLITILAGCGGKVCSECGKKVEKGYTVFGNFLCEDCFW